MHESHRSFPSLSCAQGLRAARVFIADDECMFRTSLRQLLGVPAAVVKDVYGVEIGAGFEVIGEAGTGQDTVDAVRAGQPDLLLLDISMPRLSGLQALRELAGEATGVRTIILSGEFDRSQLVTAIQLGARGLVPKDSATELLFQAITCVLDGGTWIAQALAVELVEAVRTLGPRADPGGHAQSFGRLTRREREVLSLVVEGCGNKEIAQRFAMSEETVKHHLTRMFDKVGATNRLELALAATRHHLTA